MFSNNRSRHNSSLEKIYLNSEGHLKSKSGDNQARPTVKLFKPGDMIYLNCCMHLSMELIPPAMTYSLKDEFQRLIQGSDFVLWKGIENA